MLLLQKCQVFFIKKLTFSSETHFYSTRHSARGGFTLLNSNTSARTVINRAMKEWNSLPDYLKQQKNMLSFKMNLKDFYSKQNFKE